MSIRSRSLQQENATRFGNGAVDLSRAKFWGYFEEPREQHELHGVSLQQPESLTKEKATVDLPQRQVISMRYIATVLAVGFIGWFLILLLWGSLPRPIF